MKEQMNIRINPELKENVETILKKLGLTTSEAIRMYFHMIVQNKGIPFDVRIPNDVTMKALKEAQTSNTEKLTPEELFSKLDI